MLSRCQGLLKDRHATERLLRCWGGHAGLDLKATQASIIQMLQVATCWYQLQLNSHTCHTYALGGQDNLNMSTVAHRGLETSGRCPEAVYGVHTYCGLIRKSRKCIPAALRTFSRLGLAADCKEKADTLRICLLEILP